MPRYVCISARALALFLLAGVGPVSTRAATVSGAACEAPDFDRYGVILSRRPFGVPPPVAASTNLPPGGAGTLPAVDPGKNFVLFEVVRTPVGDLVVGFTDNNAKPPRSLLLAVGEEADGYKVLSADVDLETATLEKDGVSFALRMSGGLCVPAAGAAATNSLPAIPGHEARAMDLPDFSSRMVRKNPAIAAPAVPAGQPVPNSVGVIDRMLGSGIQDNSYVERLRERREQLVKRTEEEQARREQDASVRAQATTPDLVEKRLRETNLNLIRKGLKPIGTIQLTPEEDAKLVSEGALPAP